MTKRKKNFYEKLRKLAEILSTLETLYKWGEKLWIWFGKDSTKMFIKALCKVIAVNKGRIIQFLLWLLSYILNNS